jgi:Tol biopolymer transport system component
LAFGGRASALSIGLQPASFGAGSIGLALTVQGLVAGAAPTLRSYDVRVSFDPALVSLAGATFGAELGAPPDDALVEAIAGASFVDLAAVSLLPAATLLAFQPDAFVLATLHFSIHGTGLAAFSIPEAQLGGLGGVAMTPDAVDGLTLFVPEPGTAALLGVGALLLAWRRRRGALVATVAAALLAADLARANCNVIPAAIREYPSERGRVNRPFAGPGEPVAVRVDPFCRPGQPAFDAIAANNRVVLRFEPPTGVVTEVAVPIESLSPAECDAGACNVLIFTIPDTDAEVSEDDRDQLGLAGPARILAARDGGATPVAEIATLYEPTRACDEEPERVFQRFTVMPAPNSFESLRAGGMLRATLDGGNNLLVPLDYEGSLRAPPGSPIFSILEATLDEVPAYSGGDALSLPGEGAIRSFSALGRPLPPLLRVASGDRVFGTVDAKRGVLRVQRLNPGHPDLYDFTDRLLEGRGPISIPITSASSREAAPLPSLRAGSFAAVFARDESVEGNLNRDTDLLDRVPQVLDLATGASVSTGRAVTEVSTLGFDKPALTGAGAIAAYLSSEVRENRDRNFDGDLRDDVLRVHDASGAELSAGQTIVADPTPAVDGAPLVASEDFVFFRSRESDAIEGPALPEILLPAPSAGAAPAALSSDGRYVAFESDQPFLVANDTNDAWDVFVLDRDPDGDGVYDEPGTALARVSVATGGAQANGDSRRPSISPDGRFVAFDSAAANLVAPDINDLRDVFVRDRVAETTVRVSNDGFGSQLPEDSHTPSIGSTGRFVAFHGIDPDIDFLHLADRDADRDGVLDEYGPGGEVQVSTFGRATDVSLSDDGSTLAYQSASLTEPPKTTPYVEVYWERFGERRRMPTTDGLEPNGDSSAPKLSADGRHLLFESLATNLVPGDPIDAVSGLYVYDSVADSVERADAAFGDVFGTAPLPSDAQISGDGRFLVFEAPHALLGAAQQQVFLLDRTTDEAFLADVGSAVFGETVRPAISDDGRHLAYTSFHGLVVQTGDEDPNGDGALGPDVSLNAADADARDTVLQVFDVETALLRSNARVPASIVAVASDRAALLSPESENPAATNGDADRDDAIAMVYSAVTNQLTSLAVAAERIAISDGIVCLAIPESAHPGVDNGDSDSEDALLAFWRIGQSPAALQVTPYTVSRERTLLALGAVGDACAFLSEEADGGAAPLRNASDDDEADRVIGIYSTVTEALLTSTSAQVATDLALGDAPMVAFRSCEPDDGTDHNDDGDLDDCVMRVFDLAGPTLRLVETERAAQPCRFAACDPFFEPYRVRGVTVSFLSRESEQSGPGVPRTPPHCDPTPTPGECDYTADGDADDTTIQVFNVRAETAQSFPIVEASPPSVAPFPDSVDDQTQLWVELPESAVGEDVDGDGDVDDTSVVLLTGDADEDGSLDSSGGRGNSDNCVESPNSDQGDADDDALGDDVCDANPWSFGPQSLVCDVDYDGDVDRHDVNSIFAARGALATGRTDVRDPDRSGRIDVLDGGYCADRCTHEGCRVVARACGLGAEGAFALAAIAWAGRRLRARRDRRGA